MDDHYGYDMVAEATKVSEYDQEMPQSHTTVQLVTLRYYTIIDFNEVDIRIYLPEKVIIHRGH